MIHQYKNNGYNIVLDVNSGSVHVVDDLSYDMIGLYEKEDRETITAKMLEKYAAEGIKVVDIAETFAEIEQLKEDGTLYSEDIYENKIIDFKKRKTVVKALCLHIAHDCNLACKYCFAEEGEYKGRSALIYL